MPITEVLCHAAKYKAVANERAAPKKKQYVIMLSIRH